MSEGDDDPDRNDGSVGYGRPPVEHRFKPGRSGNPAGSKHRPKRKGDAKNLKAELLDELGHRVSVTENGRRRSMPRQTILIKKLIGDALGGDAKSRDQLFKLANQAEANLNTAEAEDLIGAAKDAEILARFRAETIQQYEESDDE